MDLGIDAIDTSFNYHGFASHRALAAVAGDLLPRLTISTKVGFFPGSRGAEHSLEPARLRAALERTGRDLGRAPDLVFLHNPERSLARLPVAEARDRLARACGVLAEAASGGWCGGWGIASWHPAALLGPAGNVPRPGVLMVPCGLLVPVRTLDAADALAERWELPVAAVRGMSPFGGNATASVWRSADPRLFLPDRATGLSAVQAAFRVAWHLPRVGSVAVGSDDPAHLRELVDALGAEVVQETVRRYRALLRERARPGQRGA
ncbi:aldo/keto reductase [Streptomyces sp. DSM 44917]|uniref:Aldo/keto reductase n=1 Tax=Streptomyces boetiae TaxID=3075541 RepID=A0ABU2LAE4_9ACTN|nr:aldo/keto reductase [Streptomyces sp. DSM 44917]MDT0308460.1 aldo/keto reductase [Streptomyces sp. DSM 44917]